MLLPICMVVSLCLLPFGECSDEYNHCGDGNPSIDALYWIPNKRSTVAVIHKHYLFEFNVETHHIGERQFMHIEWPDVKTPVDSADSMRVLNGQNEYYYHVFLKMVGKDRSELFIWLYEVVADVSGWKRTLKMKEVVNKWPGRKIECSYFNGTDNNKKLQLVAFSKEAGEYKMTSMTLGMDPPEISYGFLGSAPPSIRDSLALDGDSAKCAGLVFGTPNSNFTILAKSRWTLIFGNRSVDSLHNKVDVFACKSSQITAETYFVGSSIVLFGLGILMSLMVYPLYLDTKDIEWGDHGYIALKGQPLKTVKNK